MSTHRMRRFFLGDTLIAECGKREGSGEGGYAYFCQTCGRLWGKVETGQQQWMAVNLPCERHGTSFSPGGTFLTPLVWWNRVNGSALSEQLATLTPELISYEAKVRADWLLLFHKEKLK